MGRRSDHSREELIKMTLKSAEGIVDAEGFSGLNVRKIANEIGYSIGTIYNLFDNFDALILHLNGHTCDALYEQLSAVKTGKDPKANIKALTAAYIDFTQDKPNRWALLFEHSMSDGSDLPPWFLEKIYRPMRVLEGQVAALIPQASEDRIRTTARILWSGMHGICSLAIGNKLDILTPKPVAAVVDQFVEDYIKGVCAK